MGAPSAAVSGRRSEAGKAIFWGGLSAGILDITSAFVIWGLKGISPIRILQSIAVGLLGPSAFKGGLPTAALGAACHFLIAFSAAAVFYIASRKLTFLTQRAILWGPIYGIAVYLFMYCVVQPLAGIHPRFTVVSVAQAVIVHMLCVGLPIALAVRRYAR